MLRIGVIKRFIQAIHDHHQRLVGPAVGDSIQRVQQEMLDTTLDVYREFLNINPDHLGQRSELLYLLGQREGWDRGDPGIGPVVANFSRYCQPLQNPDFLLDVDTPALPIHDPAAVIAHELVSDRFGKAERIPPGKGGVHSAEAARADKMVQVAALFYEVS